MADAQEVKPWERYQAATPSGPWEKYQTGATPLQKVLDEANVINEAHPDISAYDRLVVKNFSSSPENSINYLKKQYPSLDVKEINGRIVAKQPGEKQYRVLDPNTGFHPIDNPKEALQDVGDVGYDVLSGLGTTLATGAAGAAGGTVSGGLGAVPAAMAGGAAAGGTLEALRQKLGEHLGVNPEGLNLGDIGVSAAGGAVSPLLFGTGATAGQLAAAGGKELTKDAAKALAQSQRGALGRALDYAGQNVTPKLGEMASGIHRDVISYAKENMPAIMNVDKAGYGNVVSDLRDRLKSALGLSKQEAGNALDAARAAAAGEKVDVSAARKPLEDYLGSLMEQQKQADTPVLREQIDSVKKVLNDVFTPVQDSSLGPKPMLSEVNPATAFDLKKQLEAYSKINKMKGGTVSRLEGMSLPDAKLAMAAQDSAKALNEGINTATKDLPGGGTAEINKRYGELKQTAKDFNSATATDESMANYLNSLAAPGRRVSLEKASALDKNLGTNIVDTSNLLVAHKNFSKAPWLARSGQGTVSTARAAGAASLGAGAGYLAGKDSGYGLPGGLAGGFLGAALGGPAAIRFYINAGRQANNVLNPLRAPQNYVPVQGVPMSAWDIMAQRERAGQ